MKLRDHPLISYREVPSWPPIWLWRGGQNLPRPYGDVRILKEVMLFTIQPCSMCFLIMEHEGAEYMGVLKFGDFSFCRAIHDLLVKHCSRPIREVGDIDLSTLVLPSPFTLASSDIRAPFRKANGSFTTVRDGGEFREV